MLNRKDAADRDVMLAWHTAVFAMQGFNGKLKDLDTILHRPRPAGRRQSPEEQRDVLRQLAERYGIPLQEQVH